MGADAQNRLVVVTARRVEKLAGEVGGALGYRDAVTAGKSAEQRSRRPVVGSDRRFDGDGMAVSSMADTIHQRVEHGRRQPGAAGSFGNSDLPDEQHLRPLRRVIAGDQPAHLAVAIRHDARFGKKIGSHQQIRVRRIDVKYAGRIDKSPHRDGVSFTRAPQVSLPRHPLPGGAVRASRPRTLQPVRSRSIHLGLEFTTEQVIVIVSFFGLRRADRRPAKNVVRQAMRPRDDLSDAASAPALPAPMADRTNSRAPCGRYRIVTNRSERTDCRLATIAVRESLSDGTARTYEKKWVRARGSSTPSTMMSSFSL